MTQHDPHNISIDYASTKLHHKLNLASRLASERHTEPEKLIKWNQIQMKSLAL